MMNKKDWELAVDRLQEVLDNAKDNKDKAEKDIEELEYMINHYKVKIKGMK